MSSIQPESTSWIPADLLEWHSQSSIVVGNWLYIDGGEIWATSLNGSWKEMSFTLSINLNSSWTTSNVVASTYVYPDSIALGMSTRRPTLWLDTVKKAVYRFGGCSYNNITVAVYAFPVNDGGGVFWTEEYTGGTRAQSSVASFSGFDKPCYALSASSPTSYYSLGGIGSETVGEAFPLLLEGLVGYDFNEAQWSNSSSTPYGSNVFGDNTGFAVLGEALYVPIFGQQGILVFIGGDAPISQAAYSEGHALVSMNQITIYDIHSQTFFLQEAKGTVPTSRTSFCAVGAGSADNSTWEIFMYGGDYPGTTTTTYSPDNYTLTLGLDRVYILTLPAFQWIEAPGTSGATRAFHDCQLIGQRQMLSIGGQALNANLSAQDPWTRGLGIFDMSELTWGFDFDADAAPYIAPVPVSNFYNTSNRYPTFSNTALAEIFNPKNTSTANTPTTTTGSSTPTNSPSASDSNSSHTAAIAGGVVGGVVLLALLVGLCYHFWRKHKRSEFGAVNVEPLQESSHFWRKQKREEFGRVHVEPLPEMDTGLVPEMGEQNRPAEIYNGRYYEPRETAELS